MPDIPDGVRKRAWLDNVKDFVSRKAKEYAEGVVGPPGSPYGEAMNTVMAAGRSVLPGGGTYAEEMQKVREGREERYPGAYSVVPEVQGRARYEARKEDMVSNAPGFAAPIKVGADRWFQGSKVADADGSPRTVFHGTAAPGEISEFRTPAFFTPDYRYAEWFAKEGGGGGVGRVGEYHLALRNPLDTSTRQGASRLADAAREAGLDLRVADLGGGEWELAGRDAPLSRGPLDLAYDERVRASLERAGYDGMVGLDPFEMRDSWSYVAFKPEQIRKANK